MKRARDAARNQSGSTAVEFALVALPFFALIFGVMELGLIFMASTSLENAAMRAARQIRTGELQTAGGSATTFKTAICNNMSWLGAGCSSNLNVDVRTYGTFAAVNPPSPVVSGAVNPASLTFTPGGSCSIVMVRAYYTWTVITPLLNASLVNLSGGKRLLMTTLAFRNEPYGSTC